MRRDARSSFTRIAVVNHRVAAATGSAQAQGRPPTCSVARCVDRHVFVLRTGIPWEMLPAEIGCGSGVTCWRRLRDWQADGVWDRLHRELLRRLRDADRIDWSRACMDSSSIAAKKGVPRQVRTRPIEAGRH